MEKYKWPAETIEGYVDGLKYKRDDEFISLTKTFFTRDNANSYVKENNEKFSEEWEPVETHVSKSPGGYFRVELIYRKRQTELNV